MNDHADCTLLFAGDSITRGMPGASYFDLVAARLADSPAWSRLKPINAGRGGETVQALLHRIHPLLERYNPRWAILAIGHNDVWLPRLRGQDPLMDIILAGRARVSHQSPTPNLQTFSIAYRNLVDIVQDYVGNRLVICTCSVIGEDLSSPANRNMSMANDLIRGLAKARSLELADVWAAFSSELANFPPRSASALTPPDGWHYVKDHFRSQFASPREVNSGQGLHLTLDGVHPNSRGSKLWAQAVWHSLSMAARRLGV